MYLKFDAVNSFVPAKHDPLVPGWPGNWAHCAIYESPAVLKSCSFAVDGHGKLLWIHPDQVKRLQQMLVSTMYIIDDLQT